MKKITTAWAPNVEVEDLLRSVALLFSPWIWKNKKPVRELEKKLSDFVGQEVVAFDSARSSLYLLLKELGIGKNDEVLLQGFTCVALPNPILWVGSKPVYVDTDLSNFNIDIENLRSKITENSKAVIIQYTFGISPDLSKIKLLCQEKGLILIEDCCHNLGGEVLLNGQKYQAGSVGDAAIYSVGMEKVISGTRGGFVTAQDEKILDRIKNKQKEIPTARVRDILRGIINPIVWKSKEKLGFVGNLIYKTLLKFKLHELGLPVLELQGKKAPWLPYFMPGSNATLAINQLKKINKLNDHRKEIVEYYYSELKNTEGIKLPEKDIINKHGEPVWLRFPIVVENSKEVLKKAQEKGLYLGNWYNRVIHCKGVDLCALGYKDGDCPKSEWLVDRSINLPTHINISKSDALRIIKFLNSL